MLSHWLLFSSIGWMHWPKGATLPRLQRIAHRFVIDILFRTGTSMDSLRRWAHWGLHFGFELCRSPRFACISLLQATPRLGWNFACELLWSISCSRISRIFVLYSRLVSRENLDNSTFGGGACQTNISRARLERISLVLHLYFSFDISIDKRKFSIN